jgi:hypothetical protein
MNLPQVRSPEMVLLVFALLFAVLVADFLIPARAAQQIFRALGRLLPGWPWW